MKMNKVSILLTLFYGINLTSGATLRKVELSNGVTDVTEVKHSEDNENKPRSRTLDQLSQENVDLESYAPKLIPVGKKSAPNPSKTFFSSSRFVRFPRKMWRSTKNKDWNGLQTDRARNLKSYFDHPNSSSRTTMKNRNHYENAIQSWLFDDTNKYSNSEIDQNKFPALNNSSVFLKHSNSALIKRNGRIYGLNYEDYWYDLTKFEGDEPEEYWEQRPNTNKDYLEDYSYDGDYSDNAEGNSYDGDYSDNAEGNSYDGDYSDNAEGNSYDGDYSDNVEGNTDDGDYSDNAEANTD
ncbi:proclotting enzyme, partial [Trichonephila inaurata madagascariensis]